MSSRLAACRYAAVLVTAALAAVGGAAPGWSRPAAVDTQVTADATSHVARSGDLFYVSESEGAILRHSFRTGRTVTIATGLNEPTGIVKVGNQLLWDQQAGYSCHRKVDADEVMSLSLASKHAKPHLLIGCLTDDGPSGLTAAHGYLYLGTPGGIGRLQLSSHHFDRHFIALTRQADGSRVDGLASNGTYLYFSRCDDGTVGRVALDGAGLRYDFVSTGTRSCPQALAVGDGHLYWSDLNPVGRARLDGTDVQRSWLSVRTSEGPFFLAADSQHLYWDWGGAAHSPTFVGRIDTDHRGFTKRWTRGQGAFLLTTPGASD